MRDRCPQVAVRHMWVYQQPQPRVSAFYGVVIYMYWNERDHPVAHFHAYHAGRRASVSADGDVLAGSLEPRAVQFVREWAVLRRGEAARMRPSTRGGSNRAAVPSWSCARPRP